MAKQSLVRPAVFLSAGVPDDPGRGTYVDTADPIAIRDAVRACAAVLLRSGDLLVFGGHPAITPLVAQVAKSLGKLESVVIYQSKFFFDVTPKEVDWFQNLRWTKLCREDGKKSLPKSIHEMRQRMLNAPDLNYRAAIYIGGMDGVEREQEIFADLHRDARQIAVGSTGGAALKLWKKLPAEDPKRKRALRHDLQYQDLFEDLFEPAKR